MKVDVVLCTFSGAPFLVRQLASVAEQSRVPDRVLVFDDGSTDETLAILEQFRSRLPLEVHVNPARLGPIGNFSKGLTAANAEIVFLCDQDDVWHPDKVEAMLELFAVRPDALLVCSDASLIDAAGNRLPGTMLERLGASTASRLAPATLHAVLLRRNVISGATLAVRGSLLQIALPVPDGFWHDEWLALLAASFDGVVWADRPLTDYRLHGANTAGVRNVGPAATARGLIQVEARAFQRSKAEKLERAVSVLRTCERATPVAARLATLEDAAAHWRARAARPAWGRGRLQAVLAEVRRGGYHRYGAGWRSALRDLT